MSNPALFKLTKPTGGLRHTWFQIITRFLFCFAEDDRPCLDGLWLNTVTLNANCGSRCTSENQLCLDSLDRENKFATHIEFVILPFSFSLVYSRYPSVPVLWSLMCFVSLSIGSTINFLTFWMQKCDTIRNIEFAKFQSPQLFQAKQNLPL